MINNNQISEAPQPVRKYHLTSGHRMYRLPGLRLDENTLPQGTTPLTWSTKTVNKFPLGRQCQLALKAAERGAIDSSFRQGDFGLRHAWRLSDLRLLWASRFVASRLRGTLRCGAFFGCRFLCSGLLCGCFFSRRFFCGCLGQRFKQLRKALLVALQRGKLFTLLLYLRAEFIQYPLFFLALRYQLLPLHHTLLTDGIKLCFFLQSPLASGYPGAARLSRNAAISTARSRDT